MLISQSLLEQVRQQSLVAEENKKLPEGVLQGIYKDKLFKAFLPVELGGLALSLSQALRLFAECGSADGNFGWLVTLGAGGAYFAGYFDPEISRQYFAGSDAVVAGSGMPQGKAKKVTGGYEIGGTWPYCSGSDYASLFTANCQFEEKSIKAIALDRNQVQIDPDWQAFGLKASSSYSMVVNRQFIPDHAVFDLEGPPIQGGFPFYSFPFLLLAQSSFAALLLGVTKNFMREAESMASAYSKDRQLFILNLLAVQTSQLEGAGQVFMEQADTVWTLHTQGKFHASDQPAFRSAAQSLASLAFGTAARVFPYLGMVALNEHARINQIWRDLQTIHQHGLLRNYDNE